MAIFGAEVQADAKLIEYVDDTNQRLSIQSLANCFKNSSIKIIDGTLIGCFNPIYPNTPLIAFFVFTIPFAYFKGLTFSYWYLFSVLCLITSVLWTDSFMYLVFKIIAKRKGYKGSFKRLSKNEVVRRLLHYGTTGSN
jgi:hypothetical protein